MDGRIFEAINFAVEAHNGQFRKGTTIPYIVHPLIVMDTLIMHEANEDLVIAGVLHDVVEDSQYTIEDIREKFGDRVAELVGYATEPLKELPWRERKQHTINIVKDTEDEDVLRLICADKLHNILSLRQEYQKYKLPEGGFDEDKIWSRFNAPKEDQRWYYDELRKLFCEKNRENHLFGDFWVGVTIVFD